jgi:lysozyme family protein
MSLYDEIKNEYFDTVIVSSSRANGGTKEIRAFFHKDATYFMVQARNSVDWWKVSRSTLEAACELYESFDISL